MSSLSMSPKVIKTDIDQSGICVILLILNSNRGPILYHFQDILKYLLNIPNFPHPTSVPKQSINQSKFVMRHM